MTQKPLSPAQEFLIDSIGLDKSDVINYSEKELEKVIVNLNCWQEYQDFKN